MKAMRGVRPRASVHLRPATVCTPCFVSWPEGPGEEADPGPSTAMKALNTNAPRDSRPYVCSFKQIKWCSGLSGLWVVPHHGSSAQLLYDAKGPYVIKPNDK